MLLTRRRWKPVEAQEVLAAVDRSGLLLDEYASTYGVEEQRLVRWRRRLAADALPLVRFREVTPSAPPATSVRAEIPSEACPRYEIALPAGRAIRITGAFDDGAVRRLVEILDPRSPC